MTADSPSGIRATIRRRLPGGSQLLGCFAATALALVPALPLHGQGQYSARVWQSEDGLPVNRVHSIVQGADGYMWIATAEGISRFNGLEFESVALPPDYVFPHSGPFRLFSTADRSVWFAGPDGGLLRIDNGTAHIVWRDDSASAPVTQLLDMPDGGTLIQRGAECWRIIGNEPTPIDSKQPEITQLLNRDLATRSTTGRLGPDGRPAPLIDRNGSEWSVDSDQILSVTWPEGARRPVSLPRTGTDFEVMEMLEDREGNIWVATALHGLGLIREDRVEVLSAAAGLSKDAALAVIEDSRGSTWIANRNGGVDQLHQGRIEHFTLPVEGEQPGLISVLYEDRNGRLWAAAREGPVFRWLGWRFVEQFIDLEEPRQIRAIHQDLDGTIWFGGRRGLVRTTGRQVSQVGAEAGFPGGEVIVMAGGTEGELWLGTSQGFVLRDTNGRLQTVGSPADLHYRPVSGILVEAPDRIWVTTLGSGLFLFNGERWYHFGRQHGLPDVRLTHVIDDQLGHLWFGSAGGILRASREDLLARPGNPEEPIHWLRMDRSDGLPTRECVGGHNPAGWRFGNGSIWFPTTLGVVRLDPSQTKVNRTPPPVFIREVIVNGSSIGSGIDPIQVGPGDTRVEFLFHGLDFSAPEKVTYRARLVGHEDSWREVGGRRTTTYDALPPGDYQFQVFAMNGDGVVSKSAANVTLTVRPHFWQTDWFIAQLWLLVILLAGGIGWIIARTRLKRRIAALKIARARETERSRIARDLHDDLGASLTEISLLAGLSAEQAAGSDFQTPLDELSDRSRAVAQALDEIVWAVNPREDTLGSLVDYLAGFSTEFLDRVGITMRLDIPAGLPDTPMDTTLRHAVFLSVREAFNNIAKHSNARTAWLRISWKDDMLEIGIEDDGRGIEDKDLTHGHGLENFQTRMTACDGHCDLRPRPEGGTIVRFRVPLLAPGETNS